MNEANTAHPSVPGGPSRPVTCAYLQSAQLPPALLQWTGERFQDIPLGRAAATAWGELARVGRHTPGLQLCATPLGQAWVLGLGAPGQPDLVLVCHVSDSDSPAALSELTPHLHLVAQAAQDHQQRLATQSQLDQAAVELSFTRHAAAMLREGQPLARLGQELAHRLREALGVETLWLWPETDLRRRPVVDWVAEEPSRHEATEARRLAEAVMSRGEVISTRLSARYVAAPLLGLCGAQGAIVGRLPASQVEGAPALLDLLRALAAATCCCLDHGRLQHQAREQQAAAPGTPATSQAGPDLGAGRAHELNNLLAAICLRAEMAAADCPPAEAADHFQAIRDSALQAATQVRQWQNPGPPGQGIPGELVDLGELVRDLLERHWPGWREEAALAGARLHLASHLEEDLHVRGVPASLHEAVLALLHNSLEAMSRGGELEVTLARSERCAILRIRDSGCGMPPDVLEQACDPFYSTKREDHVGLGLTVAQHVCDAAQGRLMLASEPGQGTTVEVVLPLASPVSQRSPGARGRRRSVEMPASLNVLMADDDAGFLHSAACLLQRLGHRVVTAAEGREALQHLRHGTAYDVLLLDLSMPEMGGWEVAGLARKLHPGAAIVLLTGWGERAATINDGRLDRVLPKPISLAALAETLEEVGSVRRPKRSAPVTALYSAVQTAT